MFAEVGYQVATTNLIAACAGISPGSLYQYFSNKADIAEALAERFLSVLAATQEGLFGEDFAALPLPELADRVIDPLLAFSLAHPAAKSLLAAVSPELAAATCGLYDALRAQTELLLGERSPALSRADQKVMAEVTVQIYVGLLPLLVAASTRQRPRLIRELKAVLISYWAGAESAHTPSVPDG